MREGRRPQHRGRRSPRGPPDDGEQVAGALCRPSASTGSTTSRDPGRRAPSATTRRAVIVKTSKRRPTDATHWSTRSMAKATGMSQSTVSRIWRAFGLKPHLVDTFKLSPTRSSSKRCATSWASTSTRPTPPWCSAWTKRPRSRRSTAPRRCCHCARAPRAPHPRLRPDGTTNLYAALDVASGQGHRRHDRPPPSHRVPALLEPHQPLGARGPRGAPRRRQRLDPQDPEIHRWLVRHPRFHLHFTPTYSSWMNLVERWFAELTTKWLGRGTHRSTKELGGVDQRLDRPPGTTTRSRSSGIRPPTRSSTRLRILRADL